MKFKATLSCLLTLLTLFVGARAQVATPADVSAANKAKTELETFREKYGAVIVKSYSELPVVNGLGGSFKIMVQEYRNAGTNTKVKGLVVEVDKAEKYSTPARSFIEYSEIDSLIKGINYIAKIDKPITMLSLFEAEYKTKGDFEITVFNNAAGKISVAITAGRIGSKSVYVSPETLVTIVAQLQHAKTMLDALLSSIMAISRQFTDRNRYPVAFVVTVSKLVEECFRQISHDCIRAVWIRSVDQSFEQRRLEFSQPEKSPQIADQ